MRPFTCSVTRRTLAVTNTASVSRAERRSSSCTHWCTRRTEVDLCRTIGKRLARDSHAAHTARVRFRVGYSPRGTSSIAVLGGVLERLSPFDWPSFSIREGVYTPKLARRKYS